MQITAAGWRRNMGTNTIGAIDLDEVRVQREPPPQIFSNEIYMFVSGHDINVTWHQELKLTGAYRLELVLSREEVAKLFKLTFGDAVSRAGLGELGISVTDVAPSEAELRQAIREVPLGKFMALVSGKNKK